MIGYKKLFIWLFFLAVFILPAALYAAEDHWKGLQIIRLNKNELAPDFKLSLLNGKEVGPATYRGKVILLNFWATWCPPCRAEMPSMEKLYRDYKDKGLLILGVNYMEDAEKVKDFMKEFKLTFPIVLDKEGEVIKQYVVVGIPTSYLIDKRGRLVGKVLGERKWDSEHARAIVEELLGE